MRNKNILKKGRSWRGGLPYTYIHIFISSLPLHHSKRRKPRSFNCPFNIYIGISYHIVSHRIIYIYMFCVFDLFLVFCYEKHKKIKIINLKKHTTTQQNKNNKKKHKTKSIKAKTRKKTLKNTKKNKNKNKKQHKQKNFKTNKHTHTHHTHKKHQKSIKKNHKNK